MSQLQTSNALTSAALIYSEREINKYYKSRCISVFGVGIRHAQTHDGVNKCLKIIEGSWLEVIVE